MSYSFSGQKDVGAIGVSILVNFFRKRGWRVEDVEDDKDWRRRDVDLLVNGKSTEVKTDTHKTGNLFLEITSDGKPGCVFQSRAEVWCYLFPLQNKLYLIELPKLQLWLFQNAKDYRTKRVKSTQSGRVWYAEGIAVPLVTLEEALVAHLFYVDGSEPEPIETEQNNGDGNPGSGDSDTGTGDSEGQSVA